jgi:hypothetical protein
MSAASSAVIAAASMPAEFACYAFHLALGLRKHRSIVCRLRDFVG